jgi:hypothetical protein
MASGLELKKHTTLFLPPAKIYLVTMNQTGSTGKNTTALITLFLVFQSRHPAEETDC